mmetsp:Transcript_20731/g.48784  ORF Transcript_20731/g.48784 Transcript_20731/m.48784 type:complete len:218 (+) Transcript_20731:165-818(+)
MIAIAIAIVMMMIVVVVVVVVLIVLIALIVIVIVLAIRLLWFVLVQSIVGGTLQVSKDLPASQKGRHGFSKVLVKGVILEFKDFFRCIDPHPVVHSFEIIRWYLLFRSVRSGLGFGGCFRVAIGRGGRIGRGQLRLPQSPAAGFLFENGHVRQRRKPPAYRTGIGIGIGAIFFPSMLLLCFHFLLEFEQSLTLFFQLPQEKHPGRSTPNDADRQGRR